MRVLFADQLSPTAVSRLRDEGHEVDERPELTADDLPQAISPYEVLVVRSTPVTKAVIEASEGLSLVVRAGAGINTIDTDAAAQRGIYVSNVPGRNAAAVAELTIGLVLSIDRNIPDNVAELRRGRWDKKRFSRAQGLHGRSLGVVGLGEIGLAVAERAAALGVAVLGIHRQGRSRTVLARCEAIPVQMVPDLEALAQRSDIITFHIPATSETRGVIGRPFVDHLRPGAIVVNTARGELVDPDALIAAMDTKDIRVGLDTFPDEPPESRGDFQSKLAQHPNVYGTHHIGASTSQAQEAIADEVVRIVHLFSQGTVVNCVNLADQVLGTTTLSVRHFDEVGVLSDIFSLLRSANINVEQMENRVFAGARAAVATMHVSGDISGDLLSDLRGIEAVIHASATPRAAAPDAAPDAAREP